MSHGQVSFTNIPSLSVVAAFGLLTLTTYLPDASVSSMSMRSGFYEVVECFAGEETVSNSSTLSKQAIGDIVSFDRAPEFIQKHERINVILQVTKITKHVSNFDFEDEYEEI